MKVKVLTSFRDKNTKTIHQVGEVLEVTEERFKEILSVGKFVSKIEEKKKDDKKKSEEKSEQKTKNKK